MSKDRQIAPNVFSGVMDKDTDVRYLSEADYIDAVDIHNGYGETLGSVTFARGNVEVVVNDLPAGTNLCMGAKEDKQTGTLIYWLWNQNGDHSIYRWYPNETVDPVRLLARGPGLNIKGTNLVHHAAIVDGKMLYWTDAKYIAGGIDGNPPRELDMEKADTRNKDLEFHLYAGIAGDGQFEFGASYTFSLSLPDDPDDGIEEHTFIANGAQFSDPEAGMEWLAEEIENAFEGRVTVENCGCKLEMKVVRAALDNDDYYNLTMISSAGDVLLVPVNHYPYPLEGYHIQLIKEPAHCAPVATFVKSDKTPANNVKTLCAQFRVRWVYHTGGRSAWSPCSNVALGTGYNGEPVESLNAIEVDFTDARLQDPSWLMLVRAVEVAFRDGNTGEFKLIDRFDACEIGVIRQRITFLNDKLYQNVESDDNSPGDDIQVLKPFDPVPLFSATLATAADDKGNNLLFLGANLEGYDCPECVDMEVEAVPWDEECLVKITGRVEVINNAVDPGADPDYSEFPLNGFVVYLAGTDYWAISDNGPDGDGSFTIHDVPRGHYVLRVASYKCRFDGTASPRYNLSNGREWQRTSAPVIDCAGAVANGLVQYERTLDLSAAGGAFDLTTEPGYGTIKIQNAHYSKRHEAVANGETVFNLNEIYLLDNNAQDGSPEDRVGALNCERQRISYAGTIRITDHNGYIYVGISYTKGSAISDVQPVVTHIDLADRRLYKGDYLDLYNNTQTDIQTDGIFASYGGGTYFIINKELSFTSRKRLLEVPVVDSAGGPLEGVLVVVTRTTRHAWTGADGVGRIMCYAPWDSDNRSEDQILLLYPNDICYEHYPDNIPDELFYQVVFNVLDPGEIAPPETYLTYEFSMVGGLALSDRFVKAGGIYDFGIVYEDEANRTCGVSKGARLYVPFHPDGLTRYQVRWTIHSKPPSWARHYRIVRTRNALQQTYVQWTSKDVKYVRIPSLQEDPIPTNFSNQDFTHILIRLHIPAVPTTPGAPKLTMFWQQDGQMGYEPQALDRVRLILSDMGAPMNTATKVYEAPIVGQYVDAEKIYAVVPAPPFGSIEIKAGFLLEYYTPRQNVEEIYYEGGEDCYDIANAGDELASHLGPIQDQNHVTDAPAIGLFTGGDTYWRRQLYTETGAYNTEHQTINRLLTTPCEDIGRAFIHDPDAKQLYHYNRIRFSGKYVPNSQINDLGAFQSFDYQDINRQWGDIKWLGFANNVLLAICQFKVQPIYVNKRALLYLSGETSVGRSDRVLEIADESVSDFGTRNPESVVQEGSTVKWWDAYQGVVCEYSQAGVQAITPKMTKYFHELGRSRLAIFNDFVLGGYDRRHAMYLITFYDPRLTSMVTLGWDDAKRGWVSRYSFLPEAFGRVGQDFVTFRSGKLWRHHWNANYANFYGVQYKPQITFASNRQPGAVKLFWSLRVLSNRLFTAPEIRIPFNTNYAVGMWSRLKANKFQKYEGVFAADFLRDMNDTSPQFLAIGDPTTRRATALLRGRELRGEVMVITLEADNGAVETALQRVDVYYTASEETNP